MNSMRVRIMSSPFMTIESVKSRMFSKYNPIGKYLLNCPDLIREF